MYRTDKTLRPNDEFNLEYQNLTDKIIENYEQKWRTICFLCEGAGEHSPK
jgi:hypothetical protein